MLRVIAGLLSLLMLTEPARADFVVTPFIVSLLTSAGVAAATATAVAGTIASILVTGALIGVSLLLAKRPKLPEPSDGKILVKSAVPPKQWGVGTSRQVGALIISEMAGSTSYDVQAMHSGRISAYVRFYVGDDLVEFASDPYSPALPNPGPGYVRLPGPYSGRYMGDSPDEKDLEIDWRLGLPTETPYAKLVSALPGVITANHRGDGIATVLAIAQTPSDKSFSRRFPNGLPRVSAVADWTIAWDPRDPDQVRTAPETWKFSENPFVLLLDFYLHHEAGFKRSHELVYEPTSEYWIAAMDVCDELVPIGTGGTEKLYTASGRYDSETPRKSVVEAYLRCCDGYLEEIGGGAIVVFAGKFYPSNFTLTDLDVIDDSLVFNRNDNEDINVINVKVVSKEHDFNEVEADQMIYQPALDKGAPRKAADVNAEFSCQWRQSRRLAKIELSRQNAAARASALVNLNGENLVGRRFFRVDMPDRGQKLTGVWAEKKKLEDRVASEGGWYVEYELVDPARYEWTTEEEGAAPQVPDETEDGEYPKPNAPTLSVIRKEAGGISYAVISATNPPVTGWPNLTLSGEYQRDGDAEWSPMATVDGALQCLSGPVVDGDYSVRTWFIGATGSKGDKSPTATITVVTDDAGPLPATSIEVVDLEEAASITFAVDDDADNARKAVIYRGGATDDFEDASAVSPLLAVSAGVTRTWVDMSVSAGATYRYWVVLLNGSGVASTPAGPAEVSIPA